MKTALMFVCILSCAFLNAATLLSQDFTSTTFPPTGWTIEAPQPAAWMLSYNNYAGGTANEARLNYTPSGYGTYRLISPPIDTRKVHDMTLSFRHMLDHYDLQETVTLAVELAHDPTAFDWELWYIAPTTDIGPAQVTVPISFDLGMSETTYISFVFRGNNWNINSWFIDDIVLTYNNTLGSGTWAAGQYYPTGDVIIPNGHTLSLEAGTELYLSYEAQIAVQGRILTNGTAEQNVLISSTEGGGAVSAGVKFLNTPAANDSSIFSYTIIRGSHDTGITVNNYDKVRLSNCTIRNNTNALNAGAISLNNADIVIENCDVTDNYCLRKGSAIYCVSSSPIIRTSRFYLNSNTALGCALWFELSVIDIFENNKVTNNIGAESYPAIWFYSSSGTMYRCLVANNSHWAIFVFDSEIAITNCDIVYNTFGIGLTSNSLAIKNSILWGSGIYNINNQISPAYLQLSYSCIEGGTAGISGSGILPENYVSNTGSNPLFVNTSGGAGLGFDALTADWNLQYNSPCIDTGDLLSPLDPDGSRADMGVYPRALKPILTRAADVPFDQGRKLYLRWDRSDIDTAFHPNAYYSVWRWNPTRAEDRIWVADPSLLDFSSTYSYDGVSFRDGNRTWDYLGVNVPAINLTDYGISVTTEQDSSSTGTHAADYMVVYQNSNGFWMSLPINGYSVDNIPPYAPSRLDISRAGSDTYNLTWDAVTEGGWEGNSYEEVNLITYKVYASDTPDFEICPETYLLSSTTPEAVLTNQIADYKFYKIVASDSE